MLTRKLQLKMKIEEEVAVVEVCEQVEEVEVDAEVAEMEEWMETLEVMEVVVAVVASKVAWFPASVVMVAKVVAETAVAELELELLSSVAFVAVIPEWP